MTSAKIRQAKKKFTLSVHRGVSYIKLDNREVVRQLKNAETV